MPINLVARTRQRVPYTNYFPSIFKESTIRASKLVHIPDDVNISLMESSTMSNDYNSSSVSKDAYRQIFNKRLLINKQWMFKWWWLGNQMIHMTFLPSISPSCTFVLEVDDSACMERAEQIKVTTVPMIARKYVQPRNTSV